MSADEPVLFDVDAPPVAVPRQRPASTGTPRWTPYRPASPARCDDCTRLLVESGGAAPVARKAKWRRFCNGKSERLCYPHARIRRAIDDLPPLKGEQP